MPQAGGGNVKNHTITLRLDDSETLLLHDLCKKTGLTTSKLFRQLLHSVSVQERPSADYRDLCWRMDRIGNNINQIARRANAARNANGKDIAELVLEFTNLKAEIKTWKNRWLSQRYMQSEHDWIS